MHEELVRSLSGCPDGEYCFGCPAQSSLHCRDSLMRQAADAIEELERELKSLYKMMGTHPDPKGECGEAGVPLPKPPKEET